MRNWCWFLYLSFVVVNGMHGKHRVSNLNSSCFHCICNLYGCELSRGCSEGYCGPFYISRVYWADAGKPTLPDDDPERKNAFPDCVRSYECALTTITNYMSIHGKDCNNDGVTDCFDFIMINYNGGNDCSPPLFLTAMGRRLLLGYKDCQLY